MYSIRLICGQSGGRVSPGQRAWGCAPCARRPVPRHREGTLSRPPSAPPRASHGPPAGAPGGGRLWPRAPANAGLREPQTRERTVPCRRRLAPRGPLGRHVWAVPVSARAAPDRGRTTGSHHLVGQQQDGFEAEFPRAEVEEVFQARSQELHHHDVVVPLGPAPPDGGDAHCKRPRGASSARVRQGAGCGGRPQHPCSHPVTTHETSACFLTGPGGQQSEVTQGEHRARGAQDREGGDRAEEHNGKAEAPTTAVLR